MFTHIPYVDFAVWIKFCVDPGETDCFHSFLHSWFSLVFAVFFVCFVTSTADKVQGLTLYNYSGNYIKL